MRSGRRGNSDSSPADTPVPIELTCLHVSATDGSATDAADIYNATLSVVDGNTLYVLTSTGSLVKVSLGQSTAVSRNAKTAANALRPGDSVVVQGSATKNGNVNATSVAATGPGA